MKRKGFTLVELLAVIVILAIILIIAVPKISDTIVNSKEASFESSAKTIADQAEKKKMENDSLGIDSNIGCSDVAKLSESDYGDCSITFKGDTAYVTMYGSGKFEGLVVYDATKNNAVAVSSVATDVSNFKYSEVDGGISIDGFLMGISKIVVSDVSKCKTYVSSSWELGSNEASTYCNGGKLNGYETTIEEGEREISPSEYETTGLKLEWYYADNVVVEDTDKCKTYATNLWDISSDSASTLCNGGNVNGWTIQDYINYKSGSLDGSETSGISVNTILLDKVANVVIPDKIKDKKVVKINDGAFYSGYLTSVVIPNTITTIGNSAFMYNQLSNVVIPLSVTTIGEGAFDTNSLISVTIPSSVTTIENYAFYENDLTSVTIPSSVTTIGDSAFYGNDLTSVEIPSSVTTIGSSAFGENSLTSVTIPSSVTTIENYAFYENSLTSVEIPLGVTTIGDYSFAWNSLKSVTIPSSVTEIEDSAFMYNKLTSVEIPLGVTTIGARAFYNNKLTSVTIPSSVTTIGDSAFYGNDLTSVEIPSSVTTIGSFAFGGNSLTSVTIPSSVTTIGNYAFYVSSLSNNNLSTIVNNTGRSFDWGLIINSTSSTNYTFETGTVASTKISGKNIQITK